MTIFYKNIGPSVNDNDGQGYVNGDIWKNTITYDAYRYESNGIWKWISQDSGTIYYPFDFQETLNYTSGVTDERDPIFKSSPISNITSEDIDNWNKNDNVYFKRIEDEGFKLIDAENNIGLSYDSSGLDVSIISDHLKNLIKEIDGIGLTIGSVTGTAFDGGRGNSLELIVSQLSSSIQGNNLLNVVETLEDGLFFIDSNNNIMSSITTDGLNWAKTSTIANTGINYDILSEIIIF